MSAPTGGGGTSSGPISSPNSTVRSVHVNGLSGGYDPVKRLLPSLPAIQRTKQAPAKVRKAPRGKKGGKGR